ncbi:hypothetical protein Ddc_15109 [Ditylenchus destructor]|nr:hypothetical protein Ddc_15109 [Ditylenchus destructor]
MSQFVFNFNAGDFTSASQNFAKSNVVKLEGSEWCLGVEKMQTSKDECSKVLNIFLICERKTIMDNYLVNLGDLILHGSFIDLHFTRMYFFEPLDLEMPCFKMDFNRITDKVNGFVNEDGKFEITADIVVSSIDEDAAEGIYCHKSFVLLESPIEKLKGLSCPVKKLDGVINLEDGCVSVRVSKQLLSWHSEYFDNIFNNVNFDESSQEEMDLADFTYKQFRLLRKHVYRESSYLERRYLHTDATMQFRLKSEDGEKESDTWLNLDKVREYWQPHIQTNRETEDDSNEKLSEVICVFKDVKQMETLLELIFCVSTAYVSDENQTVSAENVGDLLRVGSYFQISKILENCEQFLRRNRYDPNFSEQCRRDLVEKYNFTSIEVPPQHIDMGRSSTDILVQLNFLDTGSEEMCSVKYESGMNIRTLFYDALTNLYSEGICDLPAKYEVECGRSIDENTLTDCVEGIEKFMFRSVCTSRIYSFDVRRKMAFAKTQADTQADDDFTSEHRDQQYSFGGRQTTAHAKTQVDDDFTSKVQPVGGNYSEDYVFVKFLDSSFPDNERKCSIRCKNALTIQKLFYDAILTLFFEGICDSPSLYELVSVRVFNSNPFVPCQTLYVTNNATFMSENILCSYIYHLDVRRRTGKVLTETDDRLSTKTIPFGHPSINEAYRKSRERKLIAKEESEQGHEPVAGPSGLNQTISQQIVSVSRLQDVRRSTSTNSNTILILVSFPESQREEVCQVPYRNEMMVQQMAQRMFWELRRKSPNIARDYEVDIVRMFDPEFFAEPFNVAMQDLVRSETESTIYHVQLKRKEKVDDYQTFRSTQKV